METVAFTQLLEKQCYMQETTIQAGIVYKQSLPVSRAVIGGEFRGKPPYTAVFV